MIGAGSIVIRDIPANSVATGNACKAIRAINENDMKYYYRDRSTGMDALTHAIEDYTTKGAWVLSAYADACAPGNPKEASVEDIKDLMAICFHRLFFTRTSTHSRS